MAKMFIHIGPYKSGTTAFQNHMWHHRESLLTEGTLYPESGIVTARWGARHLNLARGSNEDIATTFDDLRTEMAAHPSAHTVVLSAERFSVSIRGLVTRRKFYEKFNPVLVVAVRDEVALLRSWYFQTLKSSIRQHKKSKTKKLVDIEVWMKQNRDRFNYGKMLAPWIAAFGEERIIYVPYERKANVDIIAGLSNAMGLPDLERVQTNRNSNPSIGGFATRTTLKAAYFGPLSARLGLEIGSMIETKFPNLKRQEPPGFDSDSLRQYYDKANTTNFENMPNFARAYKQAIEGNSAV